MEKPSPAAEQAATERKAKEEDHGVISAGKDAHVRENADVPRVNEVHDEKQEKR